MRLQVGRRLQLLEILWPLVLVLASPAAGAEACATLGCLMRTQLDFDLYAPMPAVGRDGTGPLPAGSLLEAAGAEGASPSAAPAVCPAPARESAGESMRTTFEVTGATAATRREVAALLGVEEDALAALTAVRMDLVDAEMIAPAGNIVASGLAAAARDCAVLGAAQLGHMRVVTGNLLAAATLTLRLDTEDAARRIAKFAAARAGQGWVVTQDGPGVVTLASTGRRLVGLNVAPAKNFAPR